MEVVKTLINAAGITAALATIMHIREPAKSSMPPVIKCEPEPCQVIIERQHEALKPKDYLRYLKRNESTERPTL